MRLVSVYEVLEAPAILYKLLAEREPHQNISHTRMPSPAHHLAFYLSRPYEAWWLVCEEGNYVGTCYVTKQREVGIFLTDECRGQGLGSQVLKEIIHRFPGRLLANIAPMNEASRRFFAKHGFTPLQVTYAKD